MKKTLLWVIGIVVVVIIVVSVANKKQSETGLIKIGFIGPLSGDAAVFGEPVVNGIKLAEKRINEEGGINGRQVSVIFEDGKCDGAVAVSAAQKLINIDGVKFMIDGVCSGEVLATAPVVDSAKVLIISPSATSPKISGISPYVFRNAPSDAERGKAIANLLMKTYKRPAIISEQTDYSQGISSTFISELQDNNVVLVANETYASDITDFRSILTKIKQAKPDAILFNPQTPANLIRLVQQAHTLGIVAQFYTSEFNDPTVVGAGSSVEGMIIGVAPGLSNEGMGKDFLDAYKSVYGKEATYPYYAGAAYDALRLFADGIAKNGYDSTKVRDYLLNLKNYDGIIGKYSFKSNGDVSGIGFVFQKVVNGKLISVE